MGQWEGLRLMLIYLELQSLMLRYGAVLLRGSDVRSHEDFAAVSHSLNCGTPAPRSYCFFCELASSVGGAAPMNSSAEVADGVARLCSGFSQKLAELCVRYVRVMPEVTIDGTALGWSWEVTYNAATKDEAEAAMHKQGTTYWWLLDGYSRTATALLPTIHKEPRASEQVFQLRHPAFISWNDVRNSGDKALVFVDGTPWMVWLCGPWLTSWRRDLSRSSGRTETCSQDTFVPLRRVLAMSRGSPLRTSVGRHACPTLGSQCSSRVAGRYQWRRNDWPGAHPQRSSVR